MTPAGSRSRRSSWIQGLRYTRTISAPSAGVAVSEPASTDEPTATAIWGFHVAGLWDPARRRSITSTLKSPRGAALSRFRAYPGPDGDAEALPRGLRRRWMHRLYMVLGSPPCSLDTNSDHAYGRFYNHRSGPRAPSSERAGATTSGWTDRSLPCHPERSEGSQARRGCAAVPGRARRFPYGRKPYNPARRGRPPVQQWACRPDLVAELRRAGRSASP